MLTLPEGSRLSFAEGIKPNPHNNEKVKHWPVPTNATEVRRILGLGTYYRRFV